jgi:hypothetical protein
MADELGTAHQVDDFTLIGRAWGYRSGASATLLDHSGEVVLRFDRRMLFPSDLQRLAAKLDVPYTELTDGPSSPELLTRKPAAPTQR